MLTEQQLLQQFKALPPAKQLEVINLGSLPSSEAVKEL